jgi:hypothetical protein
VKFRLTPTAVLVRFVNEHRQGVRACAGVYVIVIAQVQHHFLDEAVGIQILYHFALQFDNVCGVCQRVIGLQVFINHNMVFDFLKLPDIGIHHIHDSAQGIYIIDHQLILNCSYQMIMRKDDHNDYGHQ